MANPAARHIEVRGAGIEEAFLELTAVAGDTIDHEDHHRTETTKEKAGR